MLVQKDTFQIYRGDIFRPYNYLITSENTITDVLFNVITTVQSSNDNLNGVWVGESVTSDSTQGLYQYTQKTYDDNTTGVRINYTVNNINEVDQPPPPPPESDTNESSGTNEDETDVNPVDTDDGVVDDNEGDIVEDIERNYISAYTYFRFMRKDLIYPSSTYFVRDFAFFRKKCFLCFECRQQVATYCILPRSAAYH